MGVIDHRLKPMLIFELTTVILDSGVENPMVTMLMEKLLGDDSHLFA